VSLREAIRLSQTVRQRLSELRDRLYLANARLTRGLRSGAESELAGVARLRRETKPDPGFLYFIGRTAVRAGRLAEAQGLLAEMEARVGTVVADSAVDRGDASDRAYASLLRAEVALARGRQEEALEAFRLARGYSPKVAGWAQEGEARTLAHGGALELAVQAYERFRREPELGTELQEPWVLAPLELGRLHERRGDTGAAAESYRLLVERWSGGDEGLPPLVEARARLARLGGQPRP